MISWFWLLERANGLVFTTFYAGLCTAFPCPFVSFHPPWLHLLLLHIKLFWLVRYILTEAGAVLAAKLLEGSAALIAQPVQAPTAPDSLREGQCALHVGVPAQEWKGEEGSDQTLLHLSTIFLSKSEWLGVLKYLKWSMLSPAKSNMLHIGELYIDKPPLHFIMSLHYNTYFLVHK